MVMDMYRIDDIEIDMDIVAGVLGNRQRITAAQNVQNCNYGFNKPNNPGICTRGNQISRPIPCKSEYRLARTTDARAEAIRNGKYLQIGDVEIF